MKLNNCLQLAEEQGVLQQKVVALETEVEQHDVEIRNLQKQLKEAEQLLVIQIFITPEFLYRNILLIHRQLLYFKPSRSYSLLLKPIENQSTLKS